MYSALHDLLLILHITAVHNPSYITGNNDEDTLCNIITIMPSFHLKSQYREITLVRQELMKCMYDNFYAERFQEVTSCSMSCGTDA